MKLRKRVLAPVLLVGLVGLLLAGTTAVAEEHEPVFADVGVLDLVLETGNDAFEFTPAGEAGPTSFENLSANNKCKLSENGPDELVDIDVTGRPGQGGNLPHAGLKDHQIGVRAKGEGTGTPCIRIDGGDSATHPQTLTIELGDFFGADKLANYAQFGLKFKFGATATVEAFNTATGDPVDSDIETCDGSDCGPDSGGDRLLLTVGSLTGPPDLFDKIVISIVSPSDGAVTLLDAPADGFDSYFKIVQEFDGVINCGDTQEVPGDGLSDASGTFIRLNNADNPDVVCDQPKGVNFEAMEKQVEFAPAEGDTPFNGRYVGRIDFSPRPDTDPPFILKYDPAGGMVFKDSRACVWADNDVPPNGPDSLPADLNEALDDLGFHDALAPLLPFDVEPPGFDPSSPTTETWCTISLRSLTQGDGTVVDSFWVFGFGDPRWGGF